MQTLEEPVPTPSKARKYASAATQGTLGLVGFGTGAMYFGPSAYIARHSDAGIWLSKLTSEDIATGIFTAGGLDWAIVNAYFSSKSVQSFTDYIGKQPTFAAKLTKGGTIVVYVASQNFSTYLVSSTTSAHAYETLVTIAGNTPGALYAGVGLMENELPQLWSLMKSTKDQLAPVDPVERLYRARITHYRQQHTEFLRLVKENWRYISSHAGELAINQDASPLDNIFDENVHGMPTTRMEKITHRIGQLLGLAATVNYTAAFSVNTFKGIVPFIPSLPLQLLAVAFLQSSAFYGNIKITTHGFTGLFDGLYNMLRGNPIDSLAYQLRPKMTTGFTLSAIPLAAFSYSVTDFMFLKEFPGNSQGLRALRMTGNVSMALYHMAGLLHFYTLMLSLLTPDQREKAFFAMEKEVERLSKMTPEEFADFAEKNSAEMNARYHIEPYADIEAGVPPVVLPAARASSANTWFGWFRRAPEVKPVAPEKSVDEIMGEFEVVRCQPSLA